ncbi:MAG TPA: glycosyltransferase 87 family protein [Thermoleophilaceae bacterium]
MRTPSISPARRDVAITAALLLAAALLAALLAARTPLGLDYSGPASTLCDCPGTPIRALAHGRLHEFLVTQPVMGSFSLLLRAPFALLGLHLTRGTELDLYRLGAFPCLFAAGLLAAYLFGRLRELRRPWLTVVLVPLLVAVNPLTGRALHYGHPEEILAAALCIGALLAAGRKRPLLAGVLLGAAFATKQWALLAVLPVIIAAGEQRARVALSAAATAALLIVPMAAGDIHRFLHGNHGAGVVAGGSVMPTNIWFPFGTDVPVLIGANGSSTPPRALPAHLAAITHPLILGTGFLLALLWWRRRPDAVPEDALLLLALILLLRCLLDPMTNSYYHLPFLMALASWEGLRRRGAPLLTVASTLMIGLTISTANSGVTLVQLNRLYLAWALPLAAVLGLLAFRPQPASASIAEPA